MKQLHTDAPLAPTPVAPAPAAAVNPVVSPAAVMATAAHDRNPQYPGYEAVRELYDEYLKLGRQYNDLATQVEQLKHELQVVRGSVNNG